MTVGATAYSKHLSRYYLTCRVVFHHVKPILQKGIKGVTSLFFHSRHTLLLCQPVLPSIFLFTVTIASQAATMSELETAITVLMKTFCTYAGSEGPKNSLSKGEAKTLLQKELPGLLEVLFTTETWHIILIL